MIQIGDRAAMLATQSLPESFIWPAVYTEAPGNCHHIIRAVSIARVMLHEARLVLAELSASASQSV